MNNIKNFSIIAHINHGKSTISDRFIQICGGLESREMSNQVLDSMEIERERGITIKAQSFTLQYKALNNISYQLNCIDTPGHVDFSYEVSRSLSACEGAVLVIDSTQGIEAQTLSNFYIAVEKKITVIPVLNKIDLPNANPKKIEKDINHVLGLNSDNIIQCSGKTGFGIINVLENIVHKIPSPVGSINQPLQALIIDTWFNNYSGIVALVRIKNGILRKKDKIIVMSTKCSYIVDNLGIFTPKRSERDVLYSGEVGWISGSMKNIHGVPVGDTITSFKTPTKYALPGFKKIKPQVYAGLFPTNSDLYRIFADALKKLSLNDSSLFYEYEYSSILGTGFRCGFLGLLHMEIIKERLEREYNLDVIVSAPTVLYEVLTIDKKIIYIKNPSELPDYKYIVELKEPIAKCTIIFPDIYLGKIINLCIEKRGTQISIDYNGQYVSLIYEIPMSELIINFFSQLKSLSEGYASLDYEFKYFKKSNVVRVDILIDNKCIDAFSFISHKDKSILKGREIINNLKELIPRQQFDIALQVSCNNKIIARNTIKQLRKDVISKCYGGDVTRKNKLLKKQKEGKKRMKKIGKVSLPSEIFFKILNVNVK